MVSKLPEMMLNLAFRPGCKSSMYIAHALGESEANDRIEHRAALSVAL